MRYLLAVFLLGVCGWAQTSLDQFDGEVGAGTVDHPNGSMACNGTQCVEATTQSVSVYDYSHNLLVKTDTTTFINNAGVTAGTIRDPRVLYDTFISRWVYVCSCANSYLIVSSADATGTWKGVQLGTDSGDLTMKPGFDANGVYITEFISGSSPFKYRTFALPQSDVTWTGGGSPSTAHLNTWTNQNYELMPAIDRNTSKAAGDAAYFMARDGSTSGSGTGQSFHLLVSYCTWSGTTFCDPQTNNTQITQSYLISTPIDETQSGTSVKLKGSESHRFFSVVESGGSHLWGMMGIGPCVTTPACNTPGVDTHDIGLAYDVNVPALTLNQSFKLSNGSIGFLFPSLDVDSQGNVLMAASGVSPTTDASVYTWYHATSDSLGFLHGPNLQTTGTQPYTCSVNPVGLPGNYTTVMQDAGNTLRLWALVAYSNSTTACQWISRLLKLQIASDPTGPVTTGNFNGVQIGGAVQ